MAHEVFISYSSQDKEVADRICSALEAEEVECWIAPRDITPGKEWGEEIVEAIRGSKIMVLLFSSGSNESQQVLREVERAVDKQVIVIPFRIEDVDPTKSLEYFLYSTHWLDAFNSDLESSIQRLKQTVEKLLAEYNSKKISAGCPNCDAENDLENRFCKECGTELDAGINKEDILREVKDSVFSEQQDYQQKLYQLSRRLYKKINSKARGLYQSLQKFYQTADSKQKIVAVVSATVILVLISAAILNLRQEPAGEIQDTAQEEKQQTYEEAEDHYQQEDYQTAIELYQQAAQENHVIAKKRLGDIYHRGLGVARDDEEAVKWYRQAAEREHKEAQYMLGFMYMGGRGVEDSDQQAREWYLKAAQQGHKDAQVALGAIYKHGLGIEEDVAEAEKWYQKAAQQRSETAKEQLEELAAED
ncbi:TIR domain-containing protein [Fuchsiella alkaliacetigena]|uniref:TIR domain-containing protein n=1 Tax=Fuchsiella alkaliacetigena TaxID=957042 RepID=UPI00200AEEBC|nr:TIR domain-containing protein [Fuchsiella alkaliacetigena]MCK8823577.1 TIR domain-containing protein [Fuchsiella alkaliacetigena]